jgi:hypothetical protein
VLVGCVGPVGEEGEVEMAFGVGQVVHLEAFELLLEVGPIREQRRHGDHGSKLRGHALCEFELGEASGWKQSGYQAMDEGHRDVRGGHQADDRQQEEGPGRRPRRRRDEQEPAELERAEDRDPSQVARDPVGAAGTGQPQARGRAEAQLPLEAASSLRDEVVPGVLLGVLGNDGKPWRAPRGIALHAGGS